LGSTSVTPGKVDGTIINPWAMAKVVKPEPKFQLPALA